MSDGNCYADDIGPALNNLLVTNLEKAMFADSRTYPARTVAGMYQQEQEIAKAEEAGLIVTAADLDEESINMACVHCAYVEDNICDECEANE